ncbi:MAG: DUF3883 domain-containing protein [Pirellulales bacterium]|nr:DUF3883 domain-containing protein [Pirellulales bacterium]
MDRKLAVKQLSYSDLTLFETQFRSLKKGNQKAINLNADVFVSRLYPSLPDTEIGKTGRIPLDLSLFGPGLRPEWNIQRKIIKQGSYKNWRLNGEFITNPRFDVLARHDYAVMEFSGEIFPTGARVVFIAAGESEDASLHSALVAGSFGSMAAITPSDLSVIVEQSNCSSEHPIRELLLEQDLEDAAVGGIAGTQRLLRRKSGGSISREELKRARQNADDVGRQGEELIFGYLAIQKESGELTDFDWTAAENAIAPYDFTITHSNAEVSKLDVKSTKGSFGRTLHISLAELLEIRDGGASYSLYRVYELDEQGGKLRIANNLTDFADQVIATLEELPQGTTVDSISVKPESLGFGEEILIDASEFPLLGSDDHDEQPSLFDT